MEAGADNLLRRDTADTSQWPPLNRTMAVQGMTERDTTTHIINTLQSVAIPFICSLGIFGNLLTVLVLCQTRLRRSVSDKQEKLVMCSGFIALAVADLSVCVCTLPRAFVSDHMVMALSRSSVPPFSMLYQMYSVALISTFTLASTWLIVLMAAMRYLAICHPLRSRSFSLARGFYVALGVVYVLSFLLNLPAFWLHMLLSETKDDGTTLFVIDVGSFSHMTVKGRVFHWVRAAIALFIPVLLLAYFNVRLIQALRASDRLRRQHAALDNGQCTYSRVSNQGGPSRLTVTLIAVVVVFVLLVYPCEMMDFLTFLTFVVKNPNAEAVILARCFVNLMQISNFAFNFVIYYVLNVQFRKTLQNMVCRYAGCGQRQDSSSRSLTRSLRSYTDRVDSTKLSRNNTCTTGTVTIL